MELEITDFVIQDNCPWCGQQENEFEYMGAYECQVVRCKKCGLVYATKVLNEKGLGKYWSNYESQVHCQSEESVVKRNVMYKIESEYVMQFMNKAERKPKVLDIGCADGSFLDEFSKAGYECYGVEYGEEAAEKSRAKYKVYVGDFAEIETEEKYDLIIFRGTIQYLLNPKAYFEKAVNSLVKGGIIYITSSPNADAFCFKLFGERFTQPVAATDRYAFTEKILTDFFEQRNMGLIGQHFFYKETPYADEKNDLAKVEQAVKEKRETGKTTGRSPSFYDNMLTLCYKKYSD